MSWICRTNWHWVEWCCDTNCNAQECKSKSPTAKPQQGNLSQLSNSPEIVARDKKHHWLWQLKDDLDNSHVHQSSKVRCLFFCLCTRTLSRPPPSLYILSHPGRAHKNRLDWRLNVFMNGYFIENEKCWMFIYWLLLRVMGAGVMYIAPPTRKRKNEQKKWILAYPPNVEDLMNMFTGVC